MAAGTVIDDRRHPGRVPWVGTAAKLNGGCT